MANSGQANQNEYQKAASKMANQSESQKASERVSFHLKTSIFTRRITIDADKMALGMIKQLAVSFLNEIYFQHSYPSNTYIGEYIRKHFQNQDNISSLYDRLLLRIYKQDTFVPFNSVSDIEAESYVSIEVSESSQSGQLSVSSPGHPQTGKLSVSPQTGQVSVGPQTGQLSVSPLGSQQNRSSPSGNSIDTPSSASASASASTSISSSSSTATTAPTTMNSSRQPLRISHEFKQESFLFITHCAACGTLIKGVFRQGYTCVHCRKNYCPKCKAKAETSGDSCLAPAAPPPAPQAPANCQPQATPPSPAGQQQPSPSSEHQAQYPTPDSGTLPTSNQAAAAAASNDNQPSNSSDRLEVNTAGMSKRKSASNLLHFNIANPFKSHQNSGQSGQQVSAKSRGSASALEPVLQQLGKIRDQQQQQQQRLVQQPANQSPPAERLEVIQVGHKSNSQGDLNLVSACVASGGARATNNGSASVQQSPTGAPAGKQPPLSSSARASAQELHSLAPTKRDSVVSNHTFISMDWIQLTGEPPCGVCTKSLKGQSLHQQQQHQHPPAPVMCKCCKLQAHALCQTLAPPDCMARIAESSRAAGEQHEPSPEQQAEEAVKVERTGVQTSSSNVSRDNIRLHRLAPSVKHVKRPDATKPIIEGWLLHTTLSDEQSRKHYWRLDDTDITLYENATSTRYFRAIALSKITRVMSANELPKRVREDVLANVERKTANSNGAQPSPSKSPALVATPSPAKSPALVAQMNAMFAFELATGSMYVVLAESESSASKWKESLAAITAAKRQQGPKLPTALEDVKLTGEPDGSADRSGEAAGKSGEPNNGAGGDNNNESQTATSAPDAAASGGSAGAAVALNSPAPVRPVEGAKVAALDAKAPAVPKQQQQQQQQTAVQRAHRQHRAPGRLPGGGNLIQPNLQRLHTRERKTIQLEPMRVPDHLLVGKYLAEHNPNSTSGFEELGSGQFGKVYAAISECRAEDAARGLWSGVPVAIKEISKARFDVRQQERLRNEAHILSTLEHPGVIVLGNMHELEDRIYIVMEQLEDDMLEMIVHTDEKRLTERVTKFLTYQILEALKYLHARSIVHCDLKPENVLLVERRSQFPQIKLCDFGFAKIIEENSFRSSLVGTPAYLAPEVVKGERYNRSVDLWSVGVIVYVSLSGEFPFNEGESIHDQISRANFMYPEQPWGKISSQAKNFINSLLRVNSDKRLSANRAQMDDWIQDYQLWCDLSELEVRVGARWVTDDADYERWSRYAAERNLQVPRSAIQLHEELSAD